MGSDTAISVLCVDDEPGFADLVATHLERQDDAITARATTSASAALERLSGDGTVDCIVSDYSMPGVDGLEFLEAVRSDHPDLPFVLFTGKGSEELAGDAISAGVTDYMQKGSGTDQYRILARRVHNAVEAYRARRRANEAQQQARTVLEASPDAIFVCVDGECVFANRAAVDLFDAGEEAALLGADVTDLIAPEDGDDTGAAPPGVESGDREVTHTCRTLATLDGATFPAEVTSRSITWEGEPGTVVVVRDRSAREEREHERARYAAAFAEAMDAIVVIDDQGRCIDANRSACELFGLDREALLGRHVSEFAPPDYDFESAWHQFEAAGAERATFPLVRADGERRTVEYAATAEIVPGEHLSVLRDVTERRELEETLQAEREALQSMYRITADRESTFDAKLRRLLELGSEFLEVPYGFLTEIEDRTQTIVEAVGDHELLEPGESCPLSEAYCRKTITRDELVTVENAVAEGWREDPAYETFEFGCYVGAKVIVDDDLYGSFCFAGVDPRDAFSDAERTFVELMARWVGYELEQKRSNEELERRNERLEEFASVVSHDLRNPLSVAHGYLDLAREDGDPEQFDRVETALDRMDRIIGDLLYLAREGTRIGETGVVDLRETAETAWHAVSGRDVDADLRLDLDDDLERIVADRDRLCQLFENLFRNALDHGGADVTIRVEATEDGFAVADDGPGVPESERERVFEQGYSTRDSAGFGLHIVDEIVAGHGWDVTVTESRAGGARFEIGGV